MSNDRYDFDAAEVTVGTSLTTLHTIEGLREQRVWNIEVENTGAVATNGFTVLIKDHPNGEYYAFLDNVNFDTPNDNMIFSTTTGPHELGAGGKAHVIIHTRSAWGVRLQAKVAAGTTTIKVRGASEVEA